MRSEGTGQGGREAAAMLGGGASGFENAPVVKGMLACAAGSVLFAGYGNVYGTGRQTFGLPSPAELAAAAVAGPSSSSSSAGGFPLSALASQLAFSSVAELFTGSILLYSAGRHSERCHGSRRFGALAVVAGCASVAAQCCLAVATASQGSAASGYREVFSSGPYCLAFACLFHYLMNVPSSSTLKLGGLLRVSEKSLLYINAAHLALGRGRASLLPSLLGLLVGSLHASVGSFRRLAIPKAIASVLSNTLGRIVNFGSGQPANGRRGREWPPAAADAAAPDAPMHGAPTYARMVAEPSEEHIARLEAMGFSRDQCVAALRQCGDSIEAAAELLLSQ